MILTNATVKGNPFTPLSWRWEAAEQLLRQSDRNLDPHYQVTRDALAYLKTGDRLKYPEIHTAHQIFEEDRLRRAELESRILVGQSDLEIAEYCNLTPEVVQVYADLFFCVRDFPGAFYWQLKHAVGRPHFYGYQDHNLRQMWNWFGLTGQQKVLNWVIQSYYAELKPGDEPTLSVYLRPSSCVDRRIQGKIAMQIFSDFQPIDRLEQEFAYYYLLTQALPTQKERDESLQEYKNDRIDYAYKFLKGQIKRQPPQRKRRNTAPVSPDIEISKIQNRLRSLEACSS